MMMGIIQDFIDFTPPQLERTGVAVEFWVRGDDGPDVTGDGESVATWSDRSGNARDATQSTAAKRPTLQTNEANGLPIVRFDGVDDDMGYGSAEIIPGLYPQPLTIGVLIRVAGASGRQHLLRIATGQAIEMVLQFTDVANQSPLLGWRAGDRRGMSGNFGLSTWDTNSVVVFTSDGVDPASTNWIYTLDGASQTWARVDIGGAGNTNFIGSNSADADFFNGDVAEIVIYTGELTASERQRLERYLGSKYGVVLTQ